MKLLYTWFVFYHISHSDRINLWCYFKVWNRKLSINQL